MANTKLSAQQINKILGNITFPNSLSTNGTIQGSGNVNIFSFGEEQQSKYFKKYEIYESEEDLLALSCAWYRIRNSSTDTNLAIRPTISKLLDRDLFPLVTDEDKELAGKVRDYYSKKIMMLKLKNEHISNYTEDLNKFVHSDGTKFVEQTFGLAYRLPQFYFYDIEIDKIFSGRKTVVSKNVIGKELKTLSFISKTVLDRRSLKRNEYWFSDENNNVVALYLDKNNPLTGIFEQLIQNPITLSGLYYTKRKHDIGFYQVEKYDLVN